MTNFYLFIDTTQAKQCCLKLLDTNYQVINEHYFATQNNLIDLINPKLNNLLSTSKLSIEGVSKIYVNIGPGSFTGERVSVSVAKTFVLVNNKIKLYTINALKLKCQGHGVAIIDAKSHKYYLAIYENNQELVAPQIIEANKLELYLKQYYYLPSYGADTFINYSLPASIYNLFDECQEPLVLDPYYIKPAI